MSYQSKPANNMVWAILTTVLCCLPFGVVSIVYASQVDGKWNSGDHAGAQEAADKAKRWAIISAVVGVVAVVLYLLVVVVIIGASNDNSNDF
jgi:ABC-type Fe3+ transport system permease subunit